MVKVKIVVVSVVAVLSVFLQPGIRAQSTIGSSSEDDFCSRMEEGWEFHALENMHLRSVLESERQRIKTLENVSYFQAEEIQRLKLDLENERRRPVTATLIGTFNTPRSQDWGYQNNRGITKADGSIYVLGSNPDYINVYENRIGFPVSKEIKYDYGTIRLGEDIVYSNESKCLYISDTASDCIWVMTTTGGHRLTKWLNNVTSLTAISLSKEGCLLVLRGGQLETYSLNATLIHSVQLPQDILYSRRVVQTSAGNFIILHYLNISSSLTMVISQLTYDGQLVNRFIPRNQSEKLRPEHLSLDSDTNRLFVADHDNHRVILFDSNVLTWSQVLLSNETNGIRRPRRLFYDASKKQLFVTHEHSKLSVFAVNFQDCP